MDNAALAERLEAFAALLDLNGSGHYTVRAYRRAADLIRSTPADVATLVRQGACPGAGRDRARHRDAAARARRDRPDRGAATSSRRRRCRSSSASRRCSASRRSGCASSGTRSGSGRCPSCARPRRQDGSTACPGIGPKTAARIDEGLAELCDREAEARDDSEPGARPRRRGRGGARRRAGRRPAARLRALDALRGRRPARSVSSRRRRCRRSSRCWSATSGASSASPPTASRSRSSVPTPESWDAELVRAIGSPEWVAAPAASSAHAKLPPPELRELDAPSAPARPARARRCPRRPPRPHDGVGRQGDRRGDGPGGAGARLRVPGDLRPHAQRPRRPGARCRRPPPAGRGDRRRERGAGAVPDPPRERVRHPPGRVARPPGRRAGRARVGADQPPRGAARTARGDHTARRRGDAPRSHDQGAASCLSHPKGRILNHRPENALDLERVFEVALETGVARGGERPPRPARPLRRARARRARRGRPDRLLDRRPLGARAREHAALGGDGASRRRAARRRPQHAARWTSS